MGRNAYETLMLSVVVFLKLTLFPGKFLKFFVESMYVLSVSDFWPSELRNIYYETFEEWSLRKVNGQPN